MNKINKHDISVFSVLLNNVLAEKIRENKFPEEPNMDICNDICPDSCNKSCNCNSDCTPEYCETECLKPVMDHIELAAEGDGIINNHHSRYYSEKIAFKFYIWKKSNQYIGNLSLVNYNKQIFITSQYLEFFSSPAPANFFALFYASAINSPHRKIAIYASSEIFSIPPALYVYSAPQCGKSDEIDMGGTVTSGTIKIYS